MAWIAALADLFDPEHLSLARECLGFAAVAFGAAYGGVKCAVRHFHDKLLQIRDEHIDQVEAAVDRGEATQVARVVLKIAEPVHQAMEARLSEKIASVEREVLSLRDYIRANSRIVHSDVESM